MMMMAKLFQQASSRFPHGCTRAMKMSTATPATQKLQKLRLMTAIKTPYHPDGRIDLDAFDRHAEHQISNGVEALIIGGTTGEGHLFSWEEHIMLIAHTKNRFGDRVVVVGNTGSNCTGEATHATEQGFAVGMDCALLINPYYGKTSDRGIMMHIEAGLNYGPAIIYNVPGRTAQDIAPEMILQLAEHEHFVGVKECMGPDRIKLLADQGLHVWSGNDDDCHHTRHTCGAMGSISVAANIVPGLYREMMFGPRNDSLADSLKPLFHWLFVEPNPIGVNTMLMQLGAAQPVFRLPYTFSPKSMREQAVHILNDIGLEHCPMFGEAVQVLEDSDFVHCLNGEQSSFNLRYSLPGTHSTL